MRQVRGLLPYAAFAVFLVGATVVALVLTTLSGPRTAPTAASASPSAAAVATTRPATDLSATGRLAYWRSEPSGDHLLWLANADNSRRRSVAKTDQPGSVTRTRWSVDGSAIGYVESGVRLVVVRVDGVTTAYTLAPELRADGYHIVDERFSPSGDRIAVTVQRQVGAQSDVYLSGPGGTLTRLTTTEDVLAADWISDTDLLVQTTGGIVGRLSASGHDQLRPLTGLTGTSPVLGDDGRVHFLAGRVQPFTASSETLVFAAGPTLYSITADGEDLRADDIPLGPDSYRLDGLWLGNAYLVHRGTNTAQLLMAASGPVELPTAGGVLERLEVSPDRRFAIGFAGSNVIRLDLGQTGNAASAVVLLGSVGQGDAWFPRTFTLARVSRASVDVPAARYVFSLGGDLWTMGADGQPSILRAGNASGQTQRRFPILPSPRWSPAGDRVLTLESLVGGFANAQLIAVAISRDGTARRYTTPSSVGMTFSWSPDGSEFAVTGLQTPLSDPSVVGTDLTISTVNASSGAVTRSIPGRDAYWTQAGLVVLSNGTYRSGDRARDGQALELVANNGEKRTVTTIAKLLTDARMQAPADTRGITGTNLLGAAADGAYVSLRVGFFAQTTGQAAFVIVRTRDGAPTIIARDFVTDDAWAPAGRLFGYTTTVASAPGSAPRQRAIVRDAETGDVVQDVEGRFAGWSPDGSWMYIARPEGLYARRLAGGDAVRFSPYGVVVAVTKP